MCETVKMSDEGIWRALLAMLKKKKIEKKENLIQR